MGFPAGEPSHSGLMQSTCFCSTIESAVANVDSPPVMVCGEQEESHNLLDYFHSRGIF